MSRSLDLALKKATQTLALVLKQGAIAENAGLFKKLFPGEKAIIIADKTTFRVAGEKSVLYYAMKV